MKVISALEDFHFAYDIVVNAEKEEEDILVNCLDATTKIYNPDDFLRKLTS